MDKFFNVTVLTAGSDWSLLPYNDNLKSLASNAPEPSVVLYTALFNWASLKQNYEFALTLVENHLKAIGCNLNLLSFSGNNS